jgi:LacI family transcriptional regulator
MSKQVPRVAILVDTATGWGRRLTHGVLKYVDKHGPWQLSIEAHCAKDAVRLPLGWKGDGVIARVANPAMARHLRAARIPVVNVSLNQFAGVTGFYRVANDPQGSARLATQHFLDRGFRNFAYCGFPFLPWVRQHCEAFMGLVQERGFSCDIYEPRGKVKSTSNWRVLHEDLGCWLESLPKPVAIFTWATQRGREIIEACQSLEIDVPHDVAVLGGDDDELLCNTTWPPMSGMIVASEQIGHEAAGVLDRLLQGKKPPTKPLYIEPTGINVRQSTDVLAIEDAELAHAIRYVRGHAFESIHVTDLLKAIPISRRSLERRFKHILGRSPVEEIRRVRLARVKQLLADTDMQVPQIARVTGFGTSEYLITIFKREFGKTPLKYRSQVRVR